MRTYSSKSNAKRCATNLQAKYSEIESFELIGNKETGFAIIFTVNVPTADVNTKILEKGSVVEQEVVRPETVKAKTSTGIKIQKNREERNGIKRPSEGTKTGAIWEVCDKYLDEHGKPPFPCALLAITSKIGLDKTTSKIQLYRWREFKGIHGRTAN